MGVSDLSDPVSEGFLNRMQPPDCAVPEIIVSAHHCACRLIIVSAASPLFSFILCGF